MQWVYLLLAGLAMLGLSLRVVSMVLSSLNQCLAEIEITRQLLRRLTRRRRKSKRDAKPRKGGRP